MIFSFVFHFSIGHKTKFHLFHFLFIFIFQNSKKHTFIYGLSKGTAVKSLHSMYSISSSLKILIFGKSRKCTEWPQMTLNTTRLNVPYHVLFYCMRDKNHFVSLYDLSFFRSLRFGVSHSVQ